MGLPPSTLQTASLRLRKPVRRDAEAIFAAYAQDPLVSRYLDWPPHRSLKTTREFVAQCIWQWSATGCFPYVVCLESLGEPIGMISMRLKDFKAEYGFVLARQFWGRGYTTQALWALMQWAFGQGRVYRAWGVCDSENAASAAVMSKAGMSYEGTLQRWHVAPALSAEPRDCQVYARVR
jgi:RimJ/RimL family protein N-acetyltransferase